MGFPWEWELVTKLGMGMGRNGNRLHGNGREWECKKPFPGISSYDGLVLIYLLLLLTVISMLNSLQIRIGLQIRLRMIAVQY